ncbi:hypothetical protein [Cryobacterium sp. TMT3-29-2]|uniref:hypothetical protein n=1 Tax=Cryobacterium sp. TMT3-29-2 TaxID=2555867 RepID=UPI00107394F4|nr:hypothetical protein [Cryobacterium sp. TMT3-29-2]TFC85941.1 hypothetical protein E3O67_11460 [Cryobacterium sp. TMT3-29-2]
MRETSDGLMNLALFAIDHATSSVVPRGGPLIPFAVIEKDGDRDLHRFEVGRLEAMVAAGRHFVREQNDLDRVAFAWDGYLSLDGERSDAVFVEASDAHAPSSVILAQCYATRGRFHTRTFAVGQPVHMGTGNLF